MPSLKRGGTGRLPMRDCTSGYERTKDHRARLLAAPESAGRDGNVPDRAQHSSAVVPESADAQQRYDELDASRDWLEQRGTGFSPVPGKFSGTWLPIDKKIAVLDDKLDDLEHDKRLC